MPAIEGAGSAGSVATKSADLTEAALEKSISEIREMEKATGEKISGGVSYAEPMKFASPANLAKRNTRLIVEKWFESVRALPLDLATQHPMDLVASQLPRLIEALR